MNNNLEVIFIFKSGRKERLNSSEVFPTEFLYGYLELIEKGYEIRMLEDSDIGMSPPLDLFSDLINKIGRLFGRLPLGMALSLFSKRFRKQLPTNGLIIATTNGIGLSLGIGKILGLVRPRVLLLAMGLMPINASWWKRFIFSIVTKKLILATISQPEQSFLQQKFKRNDILYIPFGVDNNFWKPAPNNVAIDDYVLAIGNDLNRDWNTLVEAWDESLPELIIVTSLYVPPASKNVRVIFGDWHKSKISDKEIREMYWKSKFVIVPVKETIQPSGQSVCLQAMACGKVVIMSNNLGLWSRKLMRNEENIMLVPTQDKQALSLAIDKIINDNGLKKYIEHNAIKTISDHYSVDHMTNSMADIFDSITSNHNR